MGFIAKKILAVFLMPLPMGIFFIFFGLFYLAKHQLQRSKKWLTVGIVWLFVFSYDPIANLILYPIENRYPTLHQIPKETDYIYLLGHGHTTDAKLPITSQLNKEAVVRLTEALRLYYQTDGDAKLILSGYSGLFDPTPHALMQKKLALSLNIPPENIIVRTDPKDTEEEAIAAKKITQGRPMILVTSAYHLPRAVKWFEKNGLHPIPAPTYHQASLKNPDWLGIFSASALRKSTIAFHEILGILWQALKGV